MKANDNEMANSINVEKDIIKFTTNKKKIQYKRVDE